MDLEITVSTSILKTRIQKHKERYVASYRALIKAWKKECKKYREDYENYVDAISEDLEKERKDDSEQSKKIPYPPRKPENRIKDYNRYLEMLGNHLEPAVNLSEKLYNALWHDKWDWMGGHIAWLASYADGDSIVAGALSSYDIA